MNISRSRSSGIAGAYGSSGAATASSAASPAVRSRARPSSRIRFSARFRQAVISQAAGFAGTPDSGHRSSADTRTSWTTSSAAWRSPSSRMAAETSRGHSIRKVSARTSAGSALAGSAIAVPAIAVPHRDHHHRPDRAGRGQPPRRAQAGRGHRRAAAYRAVRRYRADPDPGQQPPPSQGGHPAGEPAGKRTERGGRQRGYRPVPGQHEQVSTGAHPPGTTWRTSTEPNSTFGQSEAIFSASSTESASITRYPAITSFASTNGPSRTPVCPPRVRIRCASCAGRSSPPTVSRPSPTSRMTYSPVRCTACRCSSSVATSSVSSLRISRNSTVSSSSGPRLCPSLCRHRRYRGFDSTRPRLLACTGTGAGVRTMRPWGVRGARLAIVAALLAAGTVVNLAPASAAATLTASGGSELTAGSRDPSEQVIQLSPAPTDVQVRFPSEVGSLVARVLQFNVEGTSPMPCGQEPKEPVYVCDAPRGTTVTGVEVDYDPSGLEPPMVDSYPKSFLVTVEDLVTKATATSQVTITSSVDLVIDGPYGAKVEPSGGGIVVFVVNQGPSGAHGYLATITITGPHSI